MQALPSMLVRALPLQTGCSEARWCLHSFQSFGPLKMFFLVEVGFLCKGAPGGTTAKAVNTQKLELCCNARWSWWVFVVLCTVYSWGLDCHCQRGGIQVVNHKLMN